jgi:hypothetical protein
VVPVADAFELEPLRVRYPENTTGGVVLLRLNACGIANHSGEVASGKMRRG